MHGFKVRLTGAFSDYFKEVIYGGIDGSVTTFAVVAGFAGASLSGNEAVQLSFTIVLLFGLANLFADAASMGLGNFLSVRSEKGLYAAIRAKEQQNIDNNPILEREQTIKILEAKGFSLEHSKTLADTYRHNNEYWLDFLMHHKQELPDPRGEKEVFTGLATFFSFMIFGAIPLLPFIFQENGDAGTAFLYSCIGTFMSLVALGILKWRVIGDQLRQSLTEVVLVGGTAAVLAYFVGTFFAH